MSRIRGKDTLPERRVQEMLRSLGEKFKTHSSDLPGRPDLVLPRKNGLIYVHGCYWHQHRCRFGRVKPVTNAIFWQKKRDSNVTRDRKNRRNARILGWPVLTIWECWTKDEHNLRRRIKKFLSKHG